MGLVIDRIVSIDHSGRATARESVGRWTNWLAEEAIYQLSRETSQESAAAPPREQ